VLGIFVVILSPLREVTWLILMYQLYYIEQFVVVLGRDVRFAAAMYV
jgi:hypothetical protein